MQKKILIARGIFPSVAERLAAHFDVTANREDLELVESPEKGIVAWACDEDEPANGTSLERE